MLIYSLVIGMAVASPAFYNNRQEAQDYNADVKFEDVSFVIVPFKALIDGASSSVDLALTLLGRTGNGTSGRQAPVASVLGKIVDAYKKGAGRTAGQGEEAGRQARRFDFGKISDQPMDRNESPNEIPRITYKRTQHFTRGPAKDSYSQLNIMGNTPLQQEENVPQKEDKRQQTIENSEIVETIEDEEIDKEDDEEPYEPTKNSSGESLTLIGGGLEECGPDGHRNDEGICEYSSVEESVK